MKLSVFFIYIAWLSFFSELLPQDKNIFFISFFWFSLFLLMFTSKFQIKEVFRKDILLWLYILGIGLASWKGKISHSFDVYRDITFIRFIFTAVPIYLLARYFLDEKKFKKLILFWIVCGVIVGMIGLCEFIFHKNFIYEKCVDNYFYRRFITTHRMMATFIHPNILGAYLIVLLPLCCYLKEGKHRFLFYPVFFFLLLCITLTFSRGTWFALLLLTMILLIKRRKFKFIGIILAVLLIFTIIAQLLPEKGIWRYEIKRRFGIVNLYNYILQGHRTYRYLVGTKMFFSHPFLGIGWGYFRSEIDKYSDRRLPYEIKIPDSVYLMHLSETGIIGFIPFLLLILSAFRKQKNKFSPITLSFCGLLLNFFTFDGFLWTSSLVNFWFLLGILNNENLISKEC